MLSLLFSVVAAARLFNCVPQNSCDLVDIKVDGDVLYSDNCHWNYDFSALGSVQASSTSDCAKACLANKCGIFDFDGTTCHFYDSTPNYIVSGGGVGCGTGMVGKELVKELVQSPDYTRISLISRRELTSKEMQWKDNSKIEVKIVDFDKLDDYKSAFEDHDIGFCCLGTTRADAGSADNFIKIDHDYPLKAATIFKSLAKKDVKFMLLTSTGSNANSFLLYPKTKGLLENAITSLGFKSLGIFRPGLLFFEGERPKTRFFEGLGISVANAFGLQNTFGAPTSAVGAKMAKAGIELKEGVKIFENADILKQ
ncbi:hypothetical protein HDV06_000233 [Boothiomyces sp. JEL0866]|nr:hypothetical protein HDV06_000233 [Boothiomyces sp. JEL0866]